MREFDAGVRRVTLQDPTLSKRFAPQDPDRLFTAYGQAMGWLREHKMVSAPLMMPGPVPIYAGRNSPPPAAANVAPIGEISSEDFLYGPVVVTIRGDHVAEVVAMLGLSVCVASHPSS